MRVLEMLALLAGPVLPAPGAAVAICVLVAILPLT